MDRCRRRGRPRLAAAVFVDALGHRGAQIFGPARFRPKSLPPGCPRPVGFPEEHLGRRLPPSTSCLCRAWFCRLRSPFFSGAKLPSRKLSLQSNLPRRSSSERKARQILSHTPRCSHCRSLRQHVLALGYSLGKSRHRAPVLSTHRMPSSTRRLRSLGKSGSSLAHCSSDKNAFCIHSFSQNLSQSTSTKSLTHLDL
jgi:hypothetical protein